MDLFGFVSWSLVLLLAVTLFWPVNIPVLALAYKVRHGKEPIPIETAELWTRAAFAALALAIASVVLLAALYTLTQSMGLPAGAVQFILLIAYLPASVGLIFWILALEDLLQATSVLLLYVLLPAFPLLAVGRLGHLWETLRERAPWLLLHST